MPSFAVTVKATTDNRNGMIASFAGGSGDPAEYSFVVDPRIMYDPLNIDQVTQLSNRVAHLVHNSQWFGANPSATTTGITISETYTVSKPSGAGYAQGSESTQVRVNVSGAPAGGVPWNFSGSLTEDNANAVITLVGPGVNVTHDTTSTWDTAVSLINGDYTLSITHSIAVNTNPAASKSITLSVTLVDASLSAASGIIINPANGHRYQLVSPGGWTEYVSFAALQSTDGMFGCPATINDGAENQWVRNYLASNVPGIAGGAPFSNWVGLNDVDTEGTFTWWCAEPVTYTNWLPGEPNNAGNSDYTELLGDTGQWRDRGAQAIEYGAVEFQYIQCGGSGNCFGTHGTPGCNIDSCCQNVCVYDGFCCNNQWDSICVSEANGLCSPDIVAGPFLNPTNKHNYYLLNTGAWSEAQKKAQSLSGYLATIDNAAENTWVLNHVSRFDGNTTRTCFIGFNDQLIEGTFQWVNHSTSTYTNWASGEPNNSGDNEDFAEMGTDGKWNDNDNTGLANFNTFAIVEVPCTGDLDDNGAVDASDLGILLGAWNTASNASDLNQDGIVNAADLAILLGGWGSCG
ncbi:MAG: lectin-like protein [Phycisphaerales bacterium]